MLRAVRAKSIWLTFAGVLAGASLILATWEVAIAARGGGNYGGGVAFHGGGGGFRAGAAASAAAVSALLLCRDQDAATAPGPTPLMATWAATPSIIRVSGQALHPTLSPETAQSQAA